jgi:hypothetical protein
MKRIASAVFLALAAFMVGCSAYRGFSYSHPEGATCLTKCENARWACRPRCGSDDAVCLDDCEEAAKTCRKSCPAISVTEPENNY